MTERRHILLALIAVVCGLGLWQGSVAATVSTTATTRAAVAAPQPLPSPAASSTLPVPDPGPLDSNGQPTSFPRWPEQNAQNGCGCPGDKPQGLQPQNGGFTTSVPVGPGIETARTLGVDDGLRLTYGSDITFDGPYGHNWSLKADERVILIPPTVSLSKDADPSDADLDNLINLWLCEPPYDGAFSGPNPPGNFTAGTPPCANNGEGRQLVAEVLANANDPEGTGAYEFQLKFDHKIFDIEITDTGWLYSTGRVPDAGSGVGGCEMTIVTENSILFGCVSKDDPDTPDIQPGPQGSGVVAVVEVLPEPDLKFRLHPGQKNGVVRTILDENCEAADIFGDPLGTGTYDALGREVPLPGIVTGGLIEDCGDLQVTTRILEGDLNLDCVVDVTDDQMIAFRYGAFFGSLLYDPWFDLEPALKDFDIDIKDTQKVFGRNGSTCAGPIPPQPPMPAPAGGLPSPEGLLNQLPAGSFHALAEPGDLIHLDGTGRALLYERQPDSSYKPPPGFYTELKANPDGSFTLRDREGTRVQFDTAGLSTEKRDRNGNVEQIVRDGSGRITTIKDPLGRDLALAYNLGGRLSSVSDFAGRTTSLTYDGAGDLTEVTTPAVTGTPNGNDFPAGKTTRFTYSSGYPDGRLNHDLLTVTAPNEVAGGGPPRLTNVYDTTVGDYSYGKLVSQTLGGTNASGVPAGGTFTMVYLQSNATTVSADPNLPRNLTLITDRRGNVTQYQHNGLGNELEVREFTSGVRPTDPPAFITTHQYNDDGERVQTILPEGNSVEWVYDDSLASPRFAHGNLLSETRLPGPRGGDQTQIVTTYTYEPIYSMLRTATEARGNDAGYVPQNGGPNTPARYTATQTFDYEEGCDFAAIGAQAGLSTADAQTALVAAGICGAALGDVNGDGLTTQVRGNPIRAAQPTAHLLAGSNQAVVEGSTLQPIVSLTVYNQAGQTTKTIDPEGNVDLYEYYPENDPDGDTFDPTPGVGSDPLGYLKQTTRDAASDLARDSGTDPPPTAIRNDYSYDRVGNVIREVDGRGIDTRYAVNALNQVVQVTRAAANSVFPPDPTEPIPLTNFQYLARTFYDANGNVVRQQLEDRGDTSGVGSDNGGSGSAFVDTVYAYDILDQQLQQSDEVSDSEDLVTRSRYDPNGNRVLSIMPEGNADSAVYDERDLLFQSTGGATAPPSLVLLAGGDPVAYDTRGGLPATTTSNYDLNGNLSESVDAADTDGAAANNSDIAGAGDRTRFIYDGFDRRTGVVDSAGNQSVTQYDPAGDVVRSASFGPTGGASPASDGPDTLLAPVSSGGVIVAANLVTTNLLAASEARYDELGRAFQTDRALFVNTIATARNPDVDDGATSIGKDNLTPGDTCAVPGIPAPSSGYLGCVSSRSEYDRNSRATFAVEDDGDVSRTFYDGAGRAIKTLDPEGNTVETAYDDNGNVIETRETDASQVGGVADEVFLTTSFYDSLDRLQRSVDNVGETFEYRYDSRGDLVARADASGPTGPAIARRAFSGGALTVNTTNLFGNVSQYFYDGLGRQVRSESVLTASGEGDGTNIGADLFGVKGATPAPDISQGGGDGLVRTGVNYDGNSLQSSLLDDQGNVTVYLYDNLGRLVAETKGLTANTSPLDKATLLGSRDVVAPTVATINAPATIAAAKIDAQLAVAKTRINAVASLFPSLADSVDDSPPTTIAYGFDPERNLLILEDENDSETFSKYDAINRAIAVRVFRSGQADSFAGDPLFAPAPTSDLSNPSGAFPAVVGTTKQDFEYDGLSRLVRATDNNEPGAAADESVVTNAYDSISRGIEEQQQIGALGAKAVSSSWRAENLRSELIYPESGAFSRQLDYTYDALDRLDTVEDTGAAQAIADYDYLGGRVLVRSYPQNGTRQTYLDNAGTADIGYDGLRRTVQLRHLRADDSLVAGFTHAYDRMSNKLGETKLHNAANDEQYDYDAAYRLTDFDRPNLGAITPLHSDWTLDGAGNWTQVDSETRQHSSFNEITDRNGTAVLSDDNGNETDDGTLTFTWDAGNRLRTATRKSDGMLVATYSYDAAGRRIRKVVTNSGALDGTTDFYLDGAQEVEERDGTDAVTQQYVYGVYVDEPLVLDRNLGGGDSATGAGDQRVFYHQNTLGSVFALTAVIAEAGAQCANGTDEDGDGIVNDGCPASGPPESGAQCANSVDDDGDTVVNDGCPAGGVGIVEGYQYDAYGRPTVFAPGANTVVDFGDDDVVSTGGASAVANPYLFTGRRLDSETDLYYYRARYMNTEQGRFTGRDPLGMWGDPGNLGNGYSYVANSPVNSTDPTGRKIQCGPSLYYEGWSWCCSSYYHYWPGLSSTPNGWIITGCWYTQNRYQGSGSGGPTGPPTGSLFGSTIKSTMSNNGGGGGLGPPESIVVVWSSGNARSGSAGGGGGGGGSVEQSEAGFPACCFINGCHYPTNRKCLGLLRMGDGGGELGPPESIVVVWSSGNMRSGSTEPGCRRGISLGPCIFCRGCDSTSGGSCYGKGCPKGCKCGNWKGSGYYYCKLGVW